MTASIDLVLNCDHEGCAATVRTDGPQNVKAAREVAKSEGWATKTMRVIEGHTFGPLDFCPEHRDPERGRKN